MTQNHPYEYAKKLNVQQNDFNKIYRAKHVLSEVEGTPRAQRKISFHLSELGALCVFAGAIGFPTP